MATFSRKFRGGGCRRGRHRARHRSDGTPWSSRRRCNCKQHAQSGSAWRRAPQRSISRAENLGAGRNRGKELGISVRSRRAQLGYEIVFTWTIGVVKTGIGGGKRTKSGGSYRANSQANRWNRQEDTPGRYEGRVVAEFPAGPGTRQRALDWEQRNARRLRAEGHLSDRQKHMFP